MIEGNLLRTCRGVRHGFFDRTGGVSSGLFASLNVGRGSDDRPEDVAENRRRVAEAQGVAPQNLLTLYQIHSDQVVTVEHPDDAAGREADAMVTRRADLALGVLTADCAPVLFADAQNGVIGAAHAGWGGAFRGIVEATIDAMETLGAGRSSIVAEIGPCIAQASYEVGSEYHARFVDDNASNARFFVPSDRDGHHRFDLPAYVLMRLDEAGVGQYGWTGHDTCADETRFFSYRRSVLQGEPDYGRMVAAITLSNAC
ncbi:MAG: peptidoglycan editing factor PgeF [Rhodospirillales bacterium]|nr:peptidoglycan editing factor PgeF [Rhodospirillales bacterium]